MNFEAQLDKYAELVVRAGLNVQQGQEVLIEADLEAAPLVRLAAKHAWAAGAKSVTVMWSDEATTRLEYENAGHAGVSADARVARPAGKRPGRARRRFA